MPELPEVQTMVDDLNAVGLPGKIITKAHVYWERTIASLSVNDFKGQVQGRIIKRLYRRAKYLVFELDAGWHLIVHLRMTGRFELNARLGSRGNHVHVILQLGDLGYLMFHDTRKFGRFYLTLSPCCLLGKLGPEPLGKRFSAGVLGERLAGRRRWIKPLLLDQHFVAGLGNIYADEALWRAGIHPMRIAESLTQTEIKALHRAVRYVLRQGLRNGGTTLGRGQSNFQSLRHRRGSNAPKLKVFRRTGLPCPRCRQPIERMVLGQRSTHYCSVCQPVT